VSFENQKISDNANEVLSTILKLKPTAAKGTYVKSVTISSTMSPGVKIDPKSISK
jgi:large subunit ribosomal protein L1